MSVPLDDVAIGEGSAMSLGLEASGEFAFGGWRDLVYSLDLGNQPSILTRVKVEITWDARQAICMATATWESQSMGKRRRQGDGLAKVARAILGPSLSRRLQGRHREMKGMLRCPRMMHQRDSW